MNLQNTIPVNRVRAKGRRYAYVRGTKIALVSGFAGSETDFESAVSDAVTKHSERIAGAISGWRTDAARAIHKVTKARATRRGLAYYLSEAGIAAMLSLADDRCSLTGLPFEYGSEKKSAKWLRRPMAPSLDRIDNELGYEPQNLRLVCVCVNVAINEWGLETFESMCRAFVSFKPITFAKQLLPKG